MGLVDDDFSCFGKDALGTHTGFGQFVESIGANIKSESVNVIAEAYRDSWRPFVKHPPHLMMSKNLNGNFIWKETETRVRDLHACCLILDITIGIVTVEDSSIACHCYLRGSRKWFSLLRWLPERSSKSRLRL